MATIVGTERDDDIVGTAKADVIVGRGGRDIINGGRGNDIICGGLGPTRTENGDAVIQLLYGGPGEDVIVGGPGDEVVGGGDGVDWLLGRGGDDYVYGGEEGEGPGQADVLRGGAGTDWLDGHGGDDMLLGQAGGDYFEDGGGDNSLLGGSGNDRLLSGPGNDVIVGGPGVDTVDYITVLPRGSSLVDHCSTVTADLSAGVGSGAGFGVDALKGVNNVVTGGGQDVLTGDARANTFYVGKPCLGAPIHREIVAGGGGSDRISFDSGPWEYEAAFGPVTVDLVAGTAGQRSDFDATVVEIALNSIENVTGTEFPDVIRGDDSPNRLTTGGGTQSGVGDAIYGGGGDDRLSGSDGRDTINGDEGADTLRGRAGNDRLDGGLDVNTIDGGRGKDSCQNPDRHNGALNCEM
ncbi:calcium-binding protein [Nocardioides sp. GCM10028917]|uniref:calcium-binding protein n=1 Tax=Nocardioides sp. GCM10028917 TaxID=3273408 RepID=UPI003618609D